MQFHALLLTLLDAVSSLAFSHDPARPPTPPSGDFRCFRTAGSLLAGSPVVKVEQTPDGGWRLTRGGAPYEIRGAGGSGHLDVLKSIGGTTIRTWGIEQLSQTINGKTLLEQCEERGLTIMAGIWIQHERHGFNYSDPAQVRRQRDEVRAAVRKYKNEPAILIWGLGNEMEGPTSDGRDPRVWRELEELAKIVKEEDPSRPICTVIAGAASGKVRALIRDYPSLDILGVNAYGGAAGAGKAVAEAGWNKPFILAEYGPVGHWEVAQTKWNAPIEPSSREKASNYYGAHKGAMEDSGGRCIGTFAFVWGQKQETTATWYGMFLQSGEKLPSVDAIAYAWTGKWPSNRSPRIEKLEATFKEKEVAPGETLTVTAVASDADGDRVQIEWLVVAESTDRRVGGDKEAAPPSFPDSILQTRDQSVQIRTPRQRGGYRVFCIVRDGKGGASADNFPFFVK
jgi:hypothetical protein